MVEINIKKKKQAKLAKPLSFCFSPDVREILVTGSQNGHDVADVIRQLVEEPIRQLKDKFEIPA